MESEVKKRDLMMISFRLGRVVGDAGAADLVILEKGSLHG